MPQGVRKYIDGPALVEQYRSRGDGVTREAFCRARRIAPSTLDYWIAKSRRVTSTAPLIPVVVDAGRKTAGVALTVVLANGRRIEATGEYADAELVRLIRLAETA